MSHGRSAGATWQSMFLAKCKHEYGIDVLLSAVLLNMKQDDETFLLLQECGIMLTNMHVSESFILNQ